MMENSVGYETVKKGVNNRGQRRRQNRFIREQYKAQGKVFLPIAEYRAQTTVFQPELPRIQEIPVRDIVTKGWRYFEDKGEVNTFLPKETGPFIENYIFNPKPVYLTLANLKGFVNTEGVKPINLADFVGIPLTRQERIERYFNSL